MNKNKKSARDIPLAKKQDTYNKALPIIMIIHLLGNDMMLRSQIRQLTCDTYHIPEKEADFMISEMLQNGLLYRKSICTGSKTELLYLSKFTIATLTETSSSDVPAIAFSRKKIYENIFNTQYIIEYLLPEMEGKYDTSPDNLISYLRYSGSNMLIPSHQLYYSDYFAFFYTTCTRLNLTLADDFFYDWKAYEYDKLRFLSKSNPSILEECDTYKKDKQMRESICQTYTSEVERVKYTYSLANMMASRFYIAAILPDTVDLIYNDSLDNLSLEKLYLNLAGITLMLDRYIKQELKINLTVFVYSQSRADNFYDMEERRVYDSFTKTYKELPRSEAYLSNYGVRPSLWDNITVKYVPMDIANKYHVMP